MTPAQAAVAAMDMNIAAFEKQHGGKPKGIVLGSKIFNELIIQERIKEEKVSARLTTAFAGDSPWAIEAGTWPMLDGKIFTHVSANDWGVLLPLSL